MTAIVAFWESKLHYGIAADRQVTSEDGSVFYARKLYKHKDVVIGVSGDSTVGLCAEAVIEAVKRRKTGSFKRPITEAWCQVVRGLMLDPIGENDRKRGGDLRMLMVSPYGLYYFDASAGGYVEEICGRTDDIDDVAMYTIGSGGPDAYRYLENRSKDEGNLRTALKLACRANLFCSGGPDVEVFGEPG